MEIEISGHSGCKIEVVSEQTRLLVHKSTDDPLYSGRLQNQARKQEAFYPGPNKNITCPRIFDVVATQDNCRIEMEYIHSLNFFAFAENAGTEQVANFLENMIEFIDLEIGLSEVTELDGSVLGNKYSAIKSNLKNNSHITLDEDIHALLPALDNIFSNAPALVIPVGACHGDLTLSNILFNGNRCYLIDFLDSFVETPLMDIVKLRQDMTYNWSGLMYSGSYDKVRLSILLRYMDKEIHEHFSRYEWYGEAYDIFQLMNFLRILPYAHDPKVLAHLKTCIHSLVESCEK